MTLETTITKYNHKIKGDISAKEVLKNAMEDLKLNSQDIIHVAAKYLNENAKRRDNKKGYNTQLIDMNKYPSKNFNEDKWNDYLTSMISLGLEKKLEFQTILSTINSEDLLREYYINRYNGEEKKDIAEKIKNPKIFNYAELAVSFASELPSYIETPTSVFGLKNFNKGDYINILNQQAEKGAKPDKIIKDLLENYSDYIML